MADIRIKLMAVAFDNITLDEAVDSAIVCAQKHEKCIVVTPNAEIAQACKTDEKLCKIVENAGLVLPDGVGVIIASKILKKPLKQKVAGVEFAEELLNKAQGTGLRVYFLGGKPDVAKTAAVKMTAKYPRLIIAGFADGYFKDDAEAVAKINAATPDILYVALGSPRQEFFMQAHEEELCCSVMAGLGGSIDVLAGNVQRAPQIFISLGLEWFYRLLQQPSRIGRMMKLPVYLFEALFARIGGAK